MQNLVYIYKIQKQKSLLRYKRTILITTSREDVKFRHWKIFQLFIYLDLLLRHDLVRRNPFMGSIRTTKELNIFIYLYMHFLHAFCE